MVTTIRLKNNYENSCLKLKDCISQYNLFIILIIIYKLKYKEILKIKK